MGIKAPVRVLIAPNAFKHALSAQEAALAIEAGLLKSRLNCVCRCFPIADGGDGTLHLILEKLQGTLEQTVVTDPLGRKIYASFGLIDDGNTAIIEMAEASGLRLLSLDEYAPLSTTTVGTGEQIKAALDRGVKQIILGMGGSATIDGGIGILQALGARLLSSEGEVLSGREDRSQVAQIDTSKIDHRIFATELVVLCDVDNPLLGEKGAAAIFGPQKGASLEDVAVLETFLTRFSELTLRELGKDMSTVPRAGTAGGAAAGLWAYLNAKLVPGADYFLQLTSFNDLVEHADLVITAEGSIDQQTLSGKGPLAVAAAAKRKSLPVVGLAGRVPMDPEGLDDFFEILLAIGNEPQEMTLALQNSRGNLERTARLVGDLLSLIR